MKWKTTLVLFVIAAGVFAYLFFVERNRPGTEEATRQAQNVVNFSRDKVNGIVIQNGDDQIDIRRRDHKWRLEIPIKDQADGSVVNSLLLDLENWQKDAAISAKEMEADKNKLADYGLANPKLRLKLIGPDTPPEIFFGKDAALEGKMYVRFGNSKETFLASHSVKKAIDKKPEDFRDRKLTDLIMAQVVRVVLKTSAGEKEKDQVYVRFSPRGFVYTLPKKIEEILNSKPNDLRDRHLVRIDTKILDRLTIDAPGKGKTVLARKDENWTIASRNTTPANSDEVRRIIDRLQNEQVTKFVEDVASNLPKYGLDKPQLIVTFSSFASENTAETKAGEQPFASVAFGKVEGNDVYARVGDEPFVVAVRRNLLDRIFADPIQWQDLSIFNFKPEQIHRLSVTTDKESALVRAANNQWNWAKGSGPINQTNLQSLLDSLATLRTVRWIGSTTSLHAFDKPRLVVTFTTSSDDKAIHKLTIGAPTPDGMSFAKVDEREGTFALSNPDLNALKLSLIGQESPSPSPTATPSR